MFVYTSCNKNHDHNNTHANMDNNNKYMCNYIYMVDVYNQKHTLHIDNTSRNNILRDSDQSAFPKPGWIRLENDQLLFSTGSSVLTNTDIALRNLFF